MQSVEQLRAVEGVPDLRRGASAAERGLGVLSVLALVAVLGAMAAVSVPFALRCLVLLLALGLVLRWRWFHLHAPLRRPHSRVEERISFLGPVSLAIPGAGLLWNAPVALPGALAGAAVPAVVLAGYLVLRWRR